MSYQVFARKWRPQNFKQLVGQTHVMKALVHALEAQRLHHAYLFTGTRGVGKTTIARILAKCLSCETGITAEPCGKCAACEGIAAGHYLDLIEVDAASRTKVEDTRELLDNVQYAPTQGRFKIYIIDEVHMLSTSSFNALLKTLEEPPEHVKFLLATTDPQKLPVTVLSRCLQFNLKRMPVDMIVGHLQTIVDDENIEYNQAALKGLARAADGSMRDALSLLDQAIAYGDGALKEVDVQSMLGGASHERLYQLLKAISADDGKQVLAIVEEMAGQTPDFEMIADELISLLHQISVVQIVPDQHQDDTAIVELAALLTPEDVQLYYQMALKGRADLPYSPDPRSGFEMLLLRMLAFRLAPPMPVSQTDEKKKALATEPDVNTPPTIAHQQIEATIVPIHPPLTEPSLSEQQERWHQLLPELALAGMTAEFARHCLLQTLHDHQWLIELDVAGEQLHTPTTEKELLTALQNYYNDSGLQIRIQVGKLNAETPAKRVKRLARERQQLAEQSIQQDDFVQHLIQHYGGQIVPGSIKPIK